MAQPRGKDVDFTLRWQDDSQATLGEGKSRTTARNASLWQVRVQIPGQCPMITTVRARTKKEAMLFSRNRHPLATSITFIGKINASL